MDRHEIATKIVEIGKRMYERGFVAANDGNISARLRDGSILITPTGVSKGDMSPETLLCITPEGEIISGEGKKSSETDMHLRIYRENPEVRAVVHAHPPYSTAFAVAELPLDLPIYPEAMVILGEVPCAPYAKPGTPAVGDSIAPYCKTRRAVLLAHHGLVAWGRDLTEAWHRMESAEGYARIIMLTKYVMGIVKPLSKEQIEELKG
ncbi:MAG: class II aldolase/adducin family protein [Eubacteriales bacterium]|jgi:L-fuculose-phosphate aldolase|nr:class II aldolase/adducin family protein [Clostridiales bacterium]